MKQKVEEKSEEEEASVCAFCKKGGKGRQEGGVEGGGGLVD